MKIKKIDIIWQQSVHSTRYLFGHLKGENPLTEQQLKEASDNCHNHWAPNIGRDYFYHFTGSEYNKQQLCKVVFNPKDVFGPSEVIPITLV